MANPTFSWILFATTITITPFEVIRYGTRITIISLTRLTWQTEGEVDAGPASTRRVTRHSRRMRTLEERMLQRDYAILYQGVYCVSPVDIPISVPFSDPGLVEIAFLTAHLSTASGVAYPAVAGNEAERRLIRTIISS